jgi:undecaprenyl-diphosphatase
MAPRRLYLRNFEVGSDDEGPRIVVVDLARAHVGADDNSLAADVAELLASMAVQVGADRAAASAGAIGPEALGRSLPYLQPLALSSATRRDVKQAGDDDTDVLADLRGLVQEAAGVEEYELATLQRITLARVLAVFGAVLLFYVVLYFASNWSEIVESFSEADWENLPVIVLMAALTYPAGAISLLGAITNRLPFLLTSEVMLGQAFLNRFTPANAGGMVLRVRYLQRNGTDLALATASIGLTSAASGVMQVVFIVGFVLWSGSTGGFGLDLPEANWVAILLLGVLILGSVVWFTPLRGKLLGSRLALSAREILGELKELATNPAKVVMLFGGAAMGKLFTVIAFTQSCRAFGVDLSFAELGALYMTANTVATAVPTPGGMGAIEAALVAVLTGAGVPTAEALSITLVFRLITYWLPVPFSYLALRHLRKTDAV